MEVRRAAPDDGPGVAALVTATGGAAKYRKAYGNYNVAQLLETGYLGIVATDVDDQGVKKVKAFIVIGDAPPRCKADQAEAWAATFCENYTKGGALGTCAWIDFSAAVDGETAATRACLTFAVSILRNVDHLILARQPDKRAVEPPPEFGALFDILDKAPDLLANSDLAYCPRSTLAPTLSVRRACVEDTDDLLPVFQAQSEVLSEHFGDFFVAEIIENADESNKQLVAVVNDVAVGLLSASTDLDVTTLSACFELEPFGNFLKAAEGMAPAVTPTACAPAPAPAAFSEAEADVAAIPVGFTSNCLAVTLCCLDATHEARAADFFAAAFQLWPDREYCVVTCPPSSKPAAFLDAFITVPPKFGSTFAHTLYLLHRDALKAPAALVVRRYDPDAHREGASALVGDVDALSDDAATKMEDNPASCAFVGLMNDQVVAVVDLSRKKASTSTIDWFKANYDIESCVPFERHRARAQAVLNDMVVNPIFGSSSRFILKEAMRLYDKTLLYHEAYTNDAVPLQVLETLVPVPARWRPTPLPNEELLGRKRDDGVEDGRLLHYFARRLASEPRTEVNERVVVVGLSTCAVGMLRALLLSSKANVKRVTLISEPGTQRASSIVVDEDYPELFELAALGLGQRLRVVKARAVDVDREAKHVTLPDGARVPYDVLVLAHGLHESAAKHLVTRAETGATDFLNLVADPSYNADWNSDDVDVAAQLAQVTTIQQNATDATDLTGFVSVSSDTVAEELINAVASLGERNVVIVGDGLEALAAARRLLDFGVAAAKITIACATSSLDPLGDQVIDRVSRGALQESGVKVAYDVTLSELMREGGLLTTARFERPAEPEDAPAPAPAPIDDESDAWPAERAAPPPQVVDLDCGLVVGASAPAVAVDASDLIEEAGLDYDGRLVVDSSFRTTDESIYAAGRHTKGHGRANSLELGGHLATSLLARLLGTAEVDAMPELRRPRTVSCTLPGGLFYCRSSLPHVPKDAICLPTGMLGNDEAQKLMAKSTGVHALRDLAAARDAYSTLKVDGHGLLCEIVYLGKAPVEPRNLSAVVGKQEAHLNGAWAAYERGVVDDWIAFFRADWCAAIKHDRFPQLQDALAKLIREDDFGRDLIAQLLEERDAGRDPEALRRLRETAVGTNGANLPEKTRKLLEGAVLGYLRKNRGLLPRYSLAEAASA